MTADTPRAGGDVAATPADVVSPTSASADATLGYAEAIDELEAILAELEGADVDVDVLALQVRRAGELLAVCRRRIDHARVEVEVAVRALTGDAPDETAASGEVALGDASEAGSGSER